MRESGHWGQSWDKHGVLEEGCGRLSQMQALSGQSACKELFQEIRYRDRAAEAHALDGGVGDEILF